MFSLLRLMRGSGPSIPRRGGPQLAVDRVLVDGDFSGDRRHLYRHLSARLRGRAALLVRQTHEARRVSAGRTHT